MRLSKKPEIFRHRKGRSLRKKPIRGVFRLQSTIRGHLCPRPFPAARRRRNPNPRAPGRICFRGGRAYVPAPLCGPGAMEKTGACRRHGTHPLRTAGPTLAAGDWGAPPNIDQSRGRAGEGPGLAATPGAAGSPQKPPRRHGGTASTRTAGLAPGGLAARAAGGTE